jgi:hypothetical protein
VNVELIESKKRASQKQKKKKHIESPLRLGRGPGGDGARGPGGHGPGGDPARDCAGGSEGGHCKKGGARGETSELVKQVAELKGWDVIYLDHAIWRKQSRRPVNVEAGLGEV